MQRALTPERMDVPDLDAREHRAALAGLRRINAVSFTARQIESTVIRGLKPKPGDTVRILDVACGGGDVAGHLVRQLNRRRVSVDLTLFDRSETALNFAAKAVRSIAGNLPHILVGDALHNLPTKTFDVVTCTLFLHHLEKNDVVPVLSGMKRCTSRLMVVSDLRRSVGGWVTAWVGCRVLSRSPIVHFDGPASVRAGWTEEEFYELARSANLSNARITRRFPGRLELAWQPA